MACIALAPLPLLCCLLQSPVESAEVVISCSPARDKAAYNIAAILMLPHLECHLLLQRPLTLGRENDKLLVRGRVVCHADTMLAEDACDSRGHLYRMAGHPHIKVVGEESRKLYS